MRERLAGLFTEVARQNPHALFLTGDHGYALFDPLRRTFPDQLVNVGVAESAMVGYAAGLCRVGFRPFVYGLASFVPMRVLEQIRFDICAPGLPVIFIGDGAGIVYSKLGHSHQCAEDVAALRPLPGMQIFSPADGHELSACFSEALTSNKPAYLRIGKTDLPPIHSSPLQNTHPIEIGAPQPTPICLVATGAMSNIAARIATRLGISAITVPRLKPLSASLVLLLGRHQVVIALEEHSRYGGLASALAETIGESEGPRPRLIACGLRDEFVQEVGTYEYLQKRHGLSEDQITRVISEIRLPNE